MTASDTAEPSSLAAAPAPSVRRARRGKSRGQGMVEYALIIVLIAIVAVVALQVLGSGTNSLYGNVQNGVTRATGG